MATAEAAANVANHAGSRSPKQFQKERPGLSRPFLLHILIVKPSIRLLSDSNHITCQHNASSPPDIAFPLRRPLEQPRLTGQARP